MFKPQLIKCPFCSEKRTKHWLKTLQIYPDTNSYYCFHCGAFGELNTLNNVEINFERKSNEDLQNFQRQIWNNHTRRFSRINRRNGERFRDSFEIKSANGKYVGVHERRAPKEAKTKGKRLFGYSSDFLDFNQTYRIVEGPYDCIYPEDVCVYGKPGKEQARELKNYNLILCPDGDIWKSKESVIEWFKPFLHNKIEYVERLPNDKDPDEIPKKERRTLEWDELKKWLWKNV